MATCPIFPHRSCRVRATTHRVMAFAALASNSSERVRHRRYHAHMRLAEALSRAANRDGSSAPWEVRA